MRLSNTQRAFALSGGIMTLLAAVFCYGHTGGLLLPLLFCGVGALALWLLWHEKFTAGDLAVMLLPIGLALLIRAFLLPRATSDYEDFLSQWVAHYRVNGGFSAIRDQVGNYNVPYLYLLALLPNLPFSDLYGIKLFSILFDVLLAWGGLRLARCLTDNKNAQLLTFSALLLLPTAVINGAWWGQCDSVWGALCVLALAFALEDRPWHSAALLGLAFAFKLQAIFIIPLWLPLWLGGRLKFKHLLGFPAAFFAAILPALMVGKPLADILGVYIGQASDSASWGTLNYNSPSVFALIPYDTQLPAAASKVAIAAAFLFMAAVLALLLGILYRRKEPLDNATLVLAGAALSTGIPFFLPYMHDRYFFLGGMLLVVCACAMPRFTPAAVAAEIASLGGYHAYLTMHFFLFLTLFGVRWAQLAEGLLMLTALCFATRPLIARFMGGRAPEGSPSPAGRELPGKKKVKK